MAEQQDMQAAIAQALQGALAQMKQLAAPAPMPQVPITQGFGVPSLTGWSVPVEQEINGMTVTLYLSFPAETFSQAPNIITSLVNSGLQVRAYQKNNGSWGNGGNGWGSRGNSGGYTRGGYGRRW